MSELNDFGGSMSFMASVGEASMRLSLPSSLLIQLADDNEWLEDKVGGFKKVIVRYHGKENCFTPDEVLRALYAARDKPITHCKDCKHATMSAQGYCKYCDKLCLNDDGEPDTQVNFDADFFCGFAERMGA